MTRSSLALLFAGQGSQRLGMADEILAVDPRAARLLEAADDVLGYRLSTVMAEGPLDLLNQTQVAQAAIVFVGVAQARFLMSELGMTPAMVAGHSLGQYAALSAAGAIELEDVLRLVNERGRLVQELMPIGVGAMASIVTASVEEVQSACRRASDVGVVQIACFNAPEQMVISGTRQAVDRAIAILEEDGAGALPLAVSAPFHCALLEPVLPSFSAVVHATPMTAPRIPVIDNVTAAPLSDVDSVRESLIRQITAPVLFDASISRMIADGARTFVQCGPGRGLTVFARSVDSSVSCSTFPEVMASRGAVTSS